MTDNNILPNNYAGDFAAAALYTAPSQQIGSFGLGSEGYVSNVYHRQALNDYLTQGVEGVLGAQQFGALGVTFPENAEQSFKNYLKREAKGSILDEMAADQIYASVVEFLGREPHVRIDRNGLPYTSPKRVAEQYILADRIISLSTHTGVRKAVEELFDIGGRALVPGYSRHSLGVIVTDAKPGEYTDISAFEGSDVYKGERVNLFGNDPKQDSDLDVKIRNFLISLRGLEGIGLMYLNPNRHNQANREDIFKTKWYSGNDLPAPVDSWSMLTKHYGTESTMGLAKSIGVEKIGSRLKALLMFLKNHPESWVLKINGDREDAEKYYILEDKLPKMTIHKVK